MKIFTRADAELTKKTLRIYREELQPEKKHLIIASIFVPLQHFLYIVLLPLLISFFTQALVTNPQELGTPLILVGAMIVVSIAAIVAGHIGFITHFNHQERMTTRLSERALKGLLAHSYNFFANSKVGSLAGDVNTFSRSYLALTDVIFLQASSIVVSFITSLIIIAFIAPLMLPVLLLLTAFIMMDALRSYNKRAKYRNKRKELMSRLFGDIADTLGNQTLVRMFSSSKHEIRAVVDQRKAIETVARKEIDILQRGAETRMGIMFFFQIATLLLCMYLLSHSLLSIAALIFIITYLGRITGSMFAINGIIRLMEQAFLDAAKVTEILGEAPEVLDTPDARKLTVRSADIAFDDVSFAYHDSQKQHVFSQLNLTIPNGQSVGLVGRSGG